MNRKRISSALIALAVSVVLSCGNMEMGSSGDQGSPGQPTSQVMAPGTSQSGSRLKRMYTEWTTEDGLRVIQQDTGIWDDQLKTNCSFQMAEDGKARCLPIINNDVILMNYSTYFLNSSCTKQFVTVDAMLVNCTGNRIRYAYSFSSGLTCPGGLQTHYTLFDVAPAPVTPSILYQGDQNNCKSVDKGQMDAILSGKQVFEVLGKTPPATFVEGHLNSGGD